MQHYTSGLPQSDVLATDTDALAKVIEQHLETTGITASRFGRDAVGDPRFVGDMRAGRKFRAITIAKVLAYLAGEERLPQAPRFSWTPERDRELWELISFSGATHDEVGMMLGCTEQVSRGRIQVLRDMFDPCRESGEWLRGSCRPYPG